MAISHLVQILLPTADNSGSPFPDAVVEKIKETLVEKFGGVTAFTQNPAEGVWASGEGEESHDPIVLIEVMAPNIDEAWWAKFRDDLQEKLAQEEIVIRSQEIRRL